jgi:hypothetical protein
MLAHAAHADFIADALVRVPAPGDETEALDALASAPRPAPQTISFCEFVAGNQSRRHGADLGFVKPFIRRAFLERHDIRYQPDMRLGEDYELYARALALGARFLLLPPQGYVSVDRPGSSTPAMAPSDRSRQSQEHLRLSGRIPFAWGCGLPGGAPSRTSLDPRNGRHRSRRQTLMSDLVGRFPHVKQETCGRQES